jgi:hypothetical protein
VLQLRHSALKRAFVTVAAAGLVGGLMVSPAGVSAQESTLKRVAEGKIKPAVLTVGGVSHTLQGISGGTLDAARFNPPSSSDIREEEADAANPNDVAQFDVSEGTLGCHARNSDGNVRVNQDCTFRRQAEEIIKINPTNPNNIIVGQNDSRIGYNKCGFDYSFDGGKHFGDGLPPFYQRENHPELDGATPADPNKNTIAGGPGTAHTYDAGSDPAETFDSAGRAFFSCVTFDVRSNASGVLVTQSPVGAGGSFYDNVSATGRAFVVVEDNSPTVAHDKEFIAADAFSGSPNKDNVYVTWTLFKFGTTCGAPPDGTLQFCSSAIFGSMSTDHAVTWSTPEEISGSSPLCSFGNFFDPSRTFNTCDLDQGSDPQPMPDGTLVVPFFNQNTTTVDNQQLAVVCHPSGSSTAGTAHLNCASPSKVGTDVAGNEPQCDFGRGPEECIPGPWIRTNDFPRIGLDKGNKSLFAVWQDYRNGEFDIQISRSNDGGKTWKEGGTINPTHGFDSYFAAVDVGSNHKVAVSFFKSQRVPNENNTPGGGFAPGMPGVQDPNNKSSYWLSGRQQPDVETDTPFAAIRISPFFAPPDGGQAGFNGDYSGIAAHGSIAHPVWSDTRNSVVQTSPTQGVVHDEDVFTDARAIPTVGREQ